MADIPTTNALRKLQGPVTFTIDTGGIDISSAVLVGAQITDELGAVLITTGSVANAPGTDGYISVTTVDEKFDEIAYWYISSYILNTATDEYFGDPVLIPVRGRPQD